MARYSRLEGFEFVDCHVRSASNFGFTAQNFSDPDPLEQRESAMFIYYPNKPEERKWAYAGVGEATGIHCCATRSPEERWTLVFDDGSVFVIGGGSADYETDIISKPHSYFDRVKTLPSGQACAVGLNRKVYLRRGPNDWLEYANGLQEDGETTEIEARGFKDIGGFDTGELYACGGQGDLWRLRDGNWTRLEIPTNATLRRVLCASDGFVYVITDLGFVLYGRDDNWEIIAQEETDERLENIVEYDGKVLISTRSNIYSVGPDRFEEADLGEPTLSGKSRIASGDGVLLLAGTQDAAFFDGENWTVILEPLGG